MKAIVLAAGRGSRMKNLTDDKPKCLVEFEGRALLDWQLEAIRRAGITEIGLVTGYRREVLTGRGLVEFHNERWAETQMVYSLSQASMWLREGPCIACYSDIYYESSAISSLVQSTADVAIAYDPAWLDQWGRRFEDPLVDAETFRIDSAGRLLEIGRKPKTVEEVQGQYMGLLRFTPDGWRAFGKAWQSFPEQHRGKQQMTGVLQRLIEGGTIPVMTEPYTGHWGEFDSPSDIQANVEKR